MAMAHAMQGEKEKGLAIHFSLQKPCCAFTLYCTVVQYLVALGITVQPPV
jgi:hypothetical protein